MFAKKFKFILFAVLAFLVVSACGFLTPAGPSDPTSPEAIYTSVAQTVVAQMTQTGSNNFPTPTLVSTAVVQPTATLFPSSTPFPTFTPVPPLPTSTPFPTPTAIPCHLAQFVADVTVADGSVFKAGKSFTKTWRLKNIGSCTWTTSYNLFFVNGDKMNAATLVSLPHAVAPGQTVDVSVDLVAPDKAGTYFGNWQLRAADGTVFGLGSKGEKPFWVKIVVLEMDPNQLFNFVANVCGATWTSGAGNLPCTGQTGDDRGFVTILTAPVLESGKTEDEPTFWVHPQNVKDGWIQAEYPSFLVHEGDEFITYVGCLSNQKNCKVIFTLSYRAESGTVKTLASWSEAYEGLVTPVRIDLSELAGMNVSFILRVDAWGSAEGDNAFWLNPHINGDLRLGETPFCPTCLP